MTRRHVLAVIVAAAGLSVGCRAPSDFDPFAPYGPVRVPPPGTGEIGSNYDNSARSGAATKAFGDPLGRRPDLGRENTASRPEDRGWNSPANAAAGSAAQVDSQANASQPPRLKNLENPTWLDPRPSATDPTGASAAPRLVDNGSPSHITQPGVSPPASVASAGPPRVRLPNRSDNAEPRETPVWAQRNSWTR